MFHHTCCMQPQYDSSSVFSFQPKSQLTFGKETCTSVFGHTKRQTADYGCVIVMLLIIPQCCIHKSMFNVYWQVVRNLYMIIDRSAQEEKVLCKQCHEFGETVEASCRCLDCREILCESCKIGHKKSKLLRGQNININ